MFKLKLALVSSLVMVPFFSHSNNVEGFYIGGGIGTTNFDDGGFFKDSNVGLKSDYDGNTYKLITGYQFNRIIAIEAQYTSYGDVEYSVGNTTLLDFEHDSISLAANLGYTLDNGLRPFALIGISNIRAKIKGPSDSESDTGTALRTGLGIEYSPYFLPGTSIRAAYEMDAFEVEYSNNPKTYDQTADSWYFAVTQKF